MGTTGTSDAGKTDNSKTFCIYQDITPKIDTGGVTFALRERDYKNAQVVVKPKTYTLKIRGGCYSIDEKMGNTYVWEDQANTLASRDYKQPQAVMVKKHDRSDSVL